MWSLFIAEYGVLGSRVMSVCAVSFVLFVDSSTCRWVPGGVSVAGKCGTSLLTCLFPEAM